MDPLSKISLVDGPVPVLFWAAGIIGFLYLSVRRRRRWPLTAGLVLLTAALAVLAAHWLLIYVFSVFPEELPFEVVFWSGLPFAAFGLAVAGGTVGASWRRRILSFTAAVLVLGLASLQVNQYFQLNQTVGDLMGTSVARIPELEQKYRRPPVATRGPSDLSLPVSERWTPPDDLPDSGIFRRSTVPGKVSGFHAREAYIYLPPAYLVDERPQLPVLVLFAGQPGGPTDWLTGGQLRSTMDSFAARHRGLAPVVVVADPNGDSSANKLCMDSKLGKVDTYLSEDLPAWIESALDVDSDSSRWAVGGFSFGGTCAMQLGTMHPQLFPNVLAFGAEQEPTLAKERSKTVDAAFGGDTAAFDAVTPLNILSRASFQGSRFFLTAGRKDRDFMEHMRVLADGARRAGADVRTVDVPDAGHSWDIVVRPMPEALEFVAPAMGLQS